jgi:hypothetical protein
MVDQMNKTWKNILHLTSKGQGELFDEKTETSISSSLQVFFPINFKDELKNQFVMKSSINMCDFYVDIIQRTGITYSRSEYRNEIRALENEKFINIYREHEKTNTGKISHSLDFEKQDIFIKRVN